jgi:uncharacterized membrane protein
MSASNDPSGYVLPTRDDPALIAGADALGGPAGRRIALAAQWWTPLRVLMLLIVVTFAVGVYQKSYCFGDGWLSGGPFQQYAHACYSDVPHLYSGRGFAAGKLPYFDSGDYQSLEYPVLIGATMELASLGAHLAHGLASQTILFYELTALELLICAVVLVAAVSKLAGRRPWDAAMVALSPALLLAATINWDLVAVALAALAMLAWARRHPVLAGALLGLATAAKLYPVLLLAPLFFLCVRARKLGAFGLLLLGTVVAWLAVNLPVLLPRPQAWKVFYTFSETRGADFGSIWLALQDVAHRPVPTLNYWEGFLLVLLYIGIGWLTFTARRRPRFGQLAFLAIAAFVLANKVYSPQYVLWLIPLAVLARPRWRDFLIWQASEVLYFFAVWYYIMRQSGDRFGLTDGTYHAAIWIHVAGTVYFAVMVIRDILRPEHDPVRADGTDDPCGGVLVEGSETRTLVPPTASQASHVTVGEQS